jgi:hypothetical protein
MMGTKHYLCVFQIDKKIGTEIRDVGSDPDFSAPEPTWGICRPNIRSAVSKGSYIVFVGYYPGERDFKPYKLKGWLCVKEKITYIEALRRYPYRRNVIIRDKKDVRKVQDWKWNGKRPEGLSGELKFLTDIDVDNTIYTRNPDDDHGIDNWKCRRLFMCKKDQIAKCYEKQKCEPKKDFMKLADYVVGDYSNSLDLGCRNIDWNFVAPNGLESFNLSNNSNKHVARCLSQEQLCLIMDKAQV